MQRNTITIDTQLVRYHACRAHFPDKWAHFSRRLTLSWLYHDHAMEGIALNESDIDEALAGHHGRHYSEGQLYKRIRQTAAAIDAIRERGQRNIGPIELDDLKLYHVLLCGEQEPAAGRYRKDNEPPPHYGHEVTRAPSISYRLRKLVDQIDQSYRHLHPLRAAALMHHDFMTVWPFDERSGTAGRLLLNDWLLAHGYPPAIVHATRRQEYFNALAQGPEATWQVILEAVDMTLRAADSFFESTASRSTLVA